MTTPPLHPPGGHPPPSEPAPTPLELPAPIYAHGCLVGQRFGPGTCEEQLRVADWLRECDGRLTVGALALLADSASGFAVRTTLPDDLSLVTAQLRLEIFRPVTDDERILHATAETVHSDHQLGFARAIITGRGGPIAMTSMRCAHAAAPGGGASDVEDDPRGSPTPGPAAASVEELLSTTVGDGGVRMVARHDLTNGSGNIHGGALALMAERALVGALASIDDRRAFRPVDLEVCYLRPLPGDGATVVATARITTRTRRFVHATAEVVRPDGRPAVAVRAVYAQLASQREPF